MHFGRFDIRVVPDAPFRLDGGAMFGAVPKSLWERKKGADEKNRIQMITNCLLVAADDEVVLVDTGLGDKLSEKETGIFAVGEGGDSRLLDSVRAAGYETSDVTQIVLTHLHFDHCGWNTRREGGELVPTFPEAVYWIASGEVEHARNPNERDAVSYKADNFEPLFDHGVVELFDEKAEPVPGIRVVRAPGHTRDMCIVLVEATDATVAFWADLVPTAAHVGIPWVMGYDLFPVTTMETKRTWLERAVEGDWLCIFEHDPETPMGRIVERDGRYEVEAVEE